MSQQLETNLIVLGSAIRQNANLVPNVGAPATLMPGTVWRTVNFEGNVYPNGGGEQVDFVLDVNGVDVFSFFGNSASPFFKESVNKRGLGALIRVGTNAVVAQFQTRNPASGGGALPVDGFVTLERVIGDPALLDIAPDV